MIRDLLFQIDLFKNPVSLLFNSKVKVTSGFSFIISVCVITFLSVFFFQSDLFQKQLPISSTQSITAIARPRIDFDTKNLGLAFAISDDSTLLLQNPSYFTMQVKFMIYQSNGELLYKDVKEMKRCNASQFETHGNAFHDLGLANAYCPTNGSFTLEGYWDEPITKYFSIWISSCVNSSTSDVVCKSEEQIQDYFKDKYFNIYYADSIIDVNNYKSPIKSTFKNYYVMSDSKITKKITVTFKKVHLISDEGFLFENNIITESFMKDDTEIDFQSTQGDSPFLGAFIFYSSPDVYVVKRRYQHIQETIANLGGLANTLIFFGFFLTSLEKEFLVFKVIAKTTFSANETGNKSPLKSRPAKILRMLIDPKKEKMPSELPINSGDFPKEKEPDTLKHDLQISGRKETENLQKPNFFKLQLRNSDPPLSENFSEKTEKKTKLPLPTPMDMSQKSPNTNIRRFRYSFSNIKEKVKEIQNKQSESGPIRFWSFIKIKFRLPFFRLSKNDRKLDIAYEEFKKEIDLLELIHNVREIDKMKLILLNKHQRQLFKLLTKPMIFYSNLNNKKEDEEMPSNMKMSMLLQDLKKEVDFTELEDYFSKMKEKGVQMSEVDQRLIELIDEPAKE